MFYVAVYLCDSVLLFVRLHVCDIPSCQQKLIYYRGNYDAIQDNLSTVDWIERWNANTVTEMWDDFKMTDRSSRPLRPTQSSNK